jgi:ankyrin repeat protein
VAVSNGCAGVARLLVDNGADVNLADSHGAGPLHQATSAYVAMLLMSKGANVNAADENGLTPLHMAAFYGRSPVVTVLLRRGANPTARTTGTAALQPEKRYADVILPAGMTPLEFAEKAGQAEAAHLLAKPAGSVPGS